MDIAEDCKNSCKERRYLPPTSNTFCCQVEITIVLDASLDIEVGQSAIKIDILLEDAFDHTSDLNIIIWRNSDLNIRKDIQAGGALEIDNQVGIAPYVYFGWR